MRSFETYNLMLWVIDQSMDIPRYVSLGEIYDTIY